MFKFLNIFRFSLVTRLIGAVGLTLFIGISAWAYFNINFHKKKVKETIVTGADQLSNTIRLGTYYAMMMNSRDDINQIIKNISKQASVEAIRIYNENGMIKFSNRNYEIDRIANIKEEACNSCHMTDPPKSTFSLADRTRMLYSPKGHRLLGIISPIYNESGCSSNQCHVHSKEQKVLGVLDLVVSMGEPDKALFNFKKWIIVFALFIFLITSAIISIIVLRFVKQPMKKLIEGTQLIAKGDYTSKIDVKDNGELDQLAVAINKMGQSIAEKQAELNKQMDEYQNLFELVPCIITVQDRDYKLIRYNREFAEKFDPKPGDYCFHAYKGRDEKCPVCPVERTFEDGRSHYSEEMGISKDGTPKHWIVRTSPIMNSKGEVVAAMEMNLDITQRRVLEEQLERSEKKYHAIFDNIPNPVFVLHLDTLEILDCNESVKTVYGYDKEEIITNNFLDLFVDQDRDKYGPRIKTSSVLNQVKHINKEGKILFVDIRISVSEDTDEKVLLVTISDITKKLEAEQQLIQASKMATLGEMATGVAHELNQPLSVIKTASSFFMKKINKNEKIDDEILLTMSEEIDGHVDRATKIINRMRQFGRKSDMTFEQVQLNEVLRSAFEIFSQQLKVRGIEVLWEIEENLPMIMADSSRLEQVFINLLLNARDSIEEKWGPKKHEQDGKKIMLKTRVEGKKVIAEVGDTGKGIPKDILDKIFEPFFTTKSVGEGTGLGLSISYGIIKDCGGSIKIISEEDKGASFIITFPLDRISHDEF
jgi:histidine kinase